MNALYALRTRLFVLLPLSAALLFSCTPASPASPPAASDLPPASTTVPPPPTTPPPTSSPAPTASPVPVPLAVAFIAEGGDLSLRDIPDEHGAIIGSVPANQTGILPTGQSLAGWKEVTLPTGQTGWLDGRFLVAEITWEAFCSDPRIAPLLTALVDAVTQQDGPALQSLVHPDKGLAIRHNWWNPEVHLEAGSLPGIFTSSAGYDWGIQDGSGLPLLGPFNEIILPRLQNTFEGDYLTGCGPDILAGPTAGYVWWPFEYENLRYYTIYRPAPPELELDWRSWTVGIEFVDGRPYLRILVQYHWEI